MINLTSHEAALLKAGLNYHQLSNQLADNMSNLHIEDLPVLLERFKGDTASKMKAAGGVLSSLTKKGILVPMSDFCEGIYFHYKEEKLLEVFRALEEAGEEVEVDMTEEEFSELLVQYSI